MKKIRLILILIIGLFLVGCSGSTTEIFRFTSHEIEISVGEEEILTLIYGEYSKDSVVQYSLSKTGIVTLEDNIVTGVSVGVVEVIATIDNEKKAKLIIRVVQEDIVAMEILSDTNYFPDTGSVQLLVNIVPDTIPAGVIWSLEDTDLENEDAVSISENGLLTVSDVSVKAKIIVVATAVYDNNVKCKKAFYIKNQPTQSVTVKTESGLAQMTSGGEITLIIHSEPDEGLEDYKIESNKPDILSVLEGNKLKAASSLTKTEIVIVTVTSWDGVTGVIRIEIKK